MLFSQAGTPFGDAFASRVGELVDVVASCEINEWKGNKSIQLNIADARRSGATEARAAA